MFCKRDSPYYKELRSAWKLYGEGDEDVLSEYRHLFAQPHNPNMPFVAFQQAVFRDKISSATEEELSVIDEYINTHFEEKKDLVENPWNALKVNEAQSALDLERDYIDQ